mgnify:CR=1 FL=1
MTRDDVKKAAGIFSDQMRSMIITIGAVSALIFAIVLYLMMKVMIDRSSFSIALIKIFGYRNKEVKKMYLDGTTISFCSVRLFRFRLRRYCSMRCTSRSSCRTLRVVSTSPSRHGCIWRCSQVCLYCISLSIIYLCGRSSRCYRLKCLKIASK